MNDPVSTIFPGWKYLQSCKEMRFFESLEPSGLRDFVLLELQHVDERDAGLFAKGIAAGHASGVAIICLSGRSL
jgi:hypothetical protein